MSLCIFDLDNTLLDGDSDYLWGQFLVEKGIVNGQDYEQKNQQFYREYQQGTLDILEFLSFSLKPLSDHSLNDLYQWREQFMQQKIAPIILEKGRALIQQHRQAGQTLMIITATNRFVTELIAAELDIPHLLATEPELTKDGYTGEVQGVPCFQEGKVKRLEEWLSENQQHLQDSWFYSDSHNDIPLLEIVTHPVAVDPDDELRAYAQNKQWNIISLRA